MDNCGHTCSGGISLRPAVPPKKKGVVGCGVDNSGDELTIGHKFELTKVRAVTPYVT